MEEDENEPEPELKTYSESKTTASPQPTATSQTPKPKKMHDIYIKIHNASETMHTYQTGLFPAISSSRNQYIMTLVKVDGNYIDAEPMKNISAGSMIKVYLALWTHLMATGVIQPMMHILDNEVSAKLKPISKRIAHYNSYPRIITDKTWQEEQYKHSKIISKQS
jgi:hypothetical protein